ncbi:hypothetical protein OTSTA716_1768 [Orientia tsutsugamushi str. TA716]|uniref:Uncharacterized protein n=1 Tax=Orientia tsutsugamushi str. TA716 TaxID=1359175 RepID=A0A0F3NYQ3_ORITS|nr:hypothetical protein OTSTA716_1768 [Orientia tsutsugamushi str. TA716]
MIQVMHQHIIVKGISLDDLGKSLEAIENLNLAIKYNHFA